MKMIETEKTFALGDTGTELTINFSNVNGRDITTAELTSFSDERDQKNIFKMIEKVKDGETIPLHEISKTKTCLSRIWVGGSAENIITSLQSNGVLSTNQREEMLSAITLQRGLQRYCA